MSNNRVKRRPDRVIYISKECRFLTAHSRQTPFSISRHYPPFQNRPSLAPTVRWRPKLNRRVWRPNSTSIFQRFG